MDTLAATLKRHRPVLLIAYLLIPGAMVLVLPVFAWRWLAKHKVAQTPPPLKPVNQQPCIHC